MRFILCLLLVALGGMIPLPVLAQTQVSDMPLPALFEAAEQDSADAQFTLGMRYHTGEGVLQNYAKAALWHARAAEQGHAKAQNQLGKYYHGGLGLMKDQTQALGWFTAAAEQGDPQHIFDLGATYEKGADGSSDPAHAAALYEQASEMGHVDASVSLAVLYQSGSGVEQDFARAVALYTPHATAGHARSQNNLGLMYVRGTGVEQNYPLAVKLFSAAADQGLTVAMRNLGTMYDNGFGVPQSDELATQWYRLAGQSSVNNRSEGNQLLFDSRLVDPQGTPEDLAATLKAAKSGDPVAQFLMGWMLVEQNQPRKDRDAARWFHAAAAKGHPFAMANLGLMYFEGRGVLQDYVLGQMWLVLAASGGVSGAAALGGERGHILTAGQLNEAQDRAQQRWVAQQSLPE